MLEIIVLAFERKSDLRTWLCGWWLRVIARIRRA